MKRVVLSLLAAFAFAFARGSDVIGADARVLRLAIDQEPPSLNPILSQTIPQNDILRLIYDPLVRSDGAGNLLPGLASRVPSLENRDISADGRTITYRLRRDVRWHDGVAFSSRDVVASFHAVMNPAAIVPTRRGYDLVSAIDTPDAGTVRFHLRRPFAPFVATVFAESDSPYYVAPAHILEHDTNINQSALNAHPIGTGPFRFVRLRHGEDMDLEANPSYFLGAPKIARLAIHFIPDNNNALVALRAHEVDGILDASIPIVDEASRLPHMSAQSAPVNGYYGVMFNVARVQDVRVRRAIAMALDRAGFIAKITHGRYLPSVTDQPQALWAADHTLRAPSYDPVAARALLGQAGYSAANPLTLDLATIAGNRTHAALGVAIQAWLREVGITVVIHPYLGTLFAAPAASGGVLASGHYDAAIYGWYAGIDPDDSSQLLCDQRPPAGYNDAHYCSPELDRLEAVALSSYDRTVRKTAYARIGAILLRDVPIAFLATPVQSAVFDDRVHGVSPSLVTQTADAQAWSF